MPLRRTWLAVSITKSTVMFAPIPNSVVIPPLPGRSQGTVNLEVGSQQQVDPSEVWLAITHEDGIM